MNWYLSKIVYQIICDQGLHRPQFDEQLRLIYAEDDLHAFQSASHQLVSQPVRILLPSASQSVS